MGLEPAQERILENVLRALSTAARSLRLYPPTSPIPRQTIDSATTALEEYFADGVSELSFAVAREGFAYDGVPVGTGLVVSVELANHLRDHGVAQISILPETTSEDLLGFLTLVSREPEEIRAEGGISEVARAAGVEWVRVTDVQLTALDPALAGALDGTVPLLEIARDVKRLTDWFETISSADRDSFRESLTEFVNATGTEGADALAEALAVSLVTQTVENRDALLALALEPEGAARDIARIMFGMMDASDIATAVLDGKFGRNMLSLSSALTDLPFDRVTTSVREEVTDMLPTVGHGPDEAAFLDHMLELRESDEIEAPLAERDRTFKTVVQAGSVSEDDVARAREVTTSANAVMGTVGVRTMLALLDSHTEYEGFSASADGLAAMIPRLLERGEFEVVAYMMEELTARGTAHPEWPELPAHVERALAASVDARSASPIIRGVIEDPAHVPFAKYILHFASDLTATAVAAEAIALKAEGLDAAEQLLGRRLLDLLFVQGVRAQWFQLGPITEHLAADGGPRAVAAIESLLARPEERARQEVVTALVSVGGPSVLPLLGAALRDPDEKVATVAARGLAKTGLPGSATLLAARLSELDVDNAQFVLARELIGALARVPEPEADEALQRLASRRVLIKRGHFAEVQQLVAQAIEIRLPGGAGA